ncbi:MAG: DUF4388 domain-containing protein [Desulfuromonadales bacterium]|nr:MAG: DUF4388 domain-containing protein [Desulfuromonadales bacterium]
MSFTGDLEHLSIIDVIQLLHATRKSGTLSIKGRKGESQLVFNDGYIISANHFDNSILIGNILVEANVITAETLDRALEGQEAAGENRKPLVATLIEQGQVRKEDAYRCLETLIELTVVEILTWKRGTFTLDVKNVTISDEYRYFPEKLHQEITLHTENVLMDALRIYDEKKRDGFLVEEELADDDFSSKEPLSTGGGAVLSADDLGLADLDRLEKTIPSVFSALDDLGPALANRRKIEELGTDLSEEEQEKLISFLGNHAVPARPSIGTAQGLSVILFSPDEFMTYCATTVCRHEGIFVFASNEEPDLDPIIDQFLSKNSTPVLVFDTPDESDPRFCSSQIGGLRRKTQAKYPHLCAIQLASPLDYGFSLHAFRDGVKAVLPRPIRNERKETFATDLIRFLETFPAYLKTHGLHEEAAPSSWITESFLALRQLREPSDVAFALLQSVSATFERSLTLIVRETELIAEKGIGIRDDKSRGATPAMRFRIPLAQTSLFRDVIGKGGLFYGKTDDSDVKEHLFNAIGAPLRPTVLLLPLKCSGKTISLTYADFGKKELSPVNVDLLNILADHAGLILENGLYRKKRERSSP